MARPRDACRQPLRRRPQGKHVASRSNTRSCRHIQRFLEVCGFIATISSRHGHLSPVDLSVRSAIRLPHFPEMHCRMFPMGQLRPGPGLAHRAGGRSLRAAVRLDPLCDQIRRDLAQSTSPVVPRLRRGTLTRGARRTIRNLGPFKRRALRFPPDTVPSAAMDPGFRFRRPGMTPRASGLSSETTKGSLGGSGRRKRRPVVPSQWDDARSADPGRDRNRRDKGANRVCRGSGCGGRRNRPQPGSPRGEKRAATPRIRASSPAASGAAPAPGRPDASATPDRARRRPPSSAGTC